MEIPAERIPPGSTLPLVGMDFFPNERLQITMTGPAGASDIGIVQAGPDGHFEAFLPLPSDLPSGAYTVDAISRSGIVVRALVSIDQTAPPASYDPVFPTPAEGSPAPDIDVVPVVAVGLAVLGITVLVVRTRGSTPIR